MREKILNVLRGKFLVSDTAPKNWLFILFLSMLAVVMIASSHSADRQAYVIAKLNDDVKKLKGEFVEVRKELQKMKFESTVVKKVNKSGLKPSENPPKKIKVKKEED